MRLHPALAITCLLCATATAEAQKLYVGPRIGGTSAVQHQQGFDSGPLDGITAGFGGTLEVNSWIAFQADAAYVRKGTRTNGYKIALDYLEAPLFIRVGSNLGSSSLRPFVTAGVAQAEEIRCSGFEQGPSLALPLPRGVPQPPGGSSGVDCDRARRRHADFGSVFGVGFSATTGAVQFTAEANRTRGSDLNAHSCCELRNDVTSIVLGFSRRVR